MLDLALQPPSLAYSLLVQLGLSSELLWLPSSVSVLGLLESVVWRQFFATHLSNGKSAGGLGSDLDIRILYNPIHFIVN